MSFGTGLLYDILSDIMRSIVDHIGFLISDIYSYAVEINNTAQVSAACTYTMLLGAALCQTVDKTLLVSTPEAFFLFSVQKVCT